MESGNKSELKRLVVCCDGTWNTPEMESPTNVVRLAGNVRPRSRDGSLQVLYYDEGVGTGGWLDKYIGGAFGEGLDVNVREAYRFLANNYEDGDEIYLFGFSRGAYAVRSLAGMIGYAGVLSRGKLTEVFEAYDLYRQEKSADGDAAQAFRQRHKSKVPRITLLGCWDTVGALGIPDKLPGVSVDRAFRRRYRWLDNNIGAHVGTALHALAIDERRAEFAPKLMQVGSANQTVRQVWFAGDHGCVGGGTAHKEPLSRIALEWMVDQMGELGLGLDVDPEFSQLQDRDPNIYFNPDRNPIYGRRTRNLGSTPVFHESAVSRFLDLSHYRKSLGQGQRGLLAAAARERESGGTLKLCAEGTVLAVGQTAHAVIHAHTQRNDTKIDLEAGGQYRLSVATTQCWRDGDLPPCGAAGWRLDDAPVQAAFGRLDKWKLPLIKAARRRRVVAAASWFELIGIVRGPDDREEVIPVGTSKTFEAPFNGRLLALANDLASRVGLFDTYDNNEGWVILEVARLA